MILQSTVTSNWSATMNTEQWSRPGYREFLYQNTQNQIPSLWQYLFKLDSLAINLFMYYYYNNSICEAESVALRFDESNHYQS